MYILQLVRRTCDCDCGEIHKVVPVKDIAVFTEKKAAERVIEDGDLYANYQKQYRGWSVALSILSLPLNPPLTDIIRDSDDSSEEEPPKKKKKKTNKRSKKVVEESESESD